MKNMNNLVKNTDIENLIYGQTIEIPSLMVRFKRYLPIEEKFGLASRIVSCLYDEDTNIYDGANEIMFLPVYFAEAYCKEYVFPKDETETDISGIYDFFKSSGALDEIHQYLGSEISEVEILIKEIVNIKYKKNSIQSLLSRFLKDIQSKTPEEIEKLVSTVSNLSKDENILNMLNLKNR